QMNHLLNLFQRIVSLAPQLPEEAYAMARSVEEPGKLADFIAFSLDIKLEQKQEVLEILDVHERLRRVAELAGEQLSVLELTNKIQQETHKEMDKAQREYYLRQQLKQIQEELGEGDERLAELQELRQKIEEAKMPEEARKAADRELDRLSRIPPASPEYTVSRNYLDWLIALPWSVETEDVIDLHATQRILDEDHYDLQEAKERIVEYLAVRKLKKDTKGPILCFVGPPGVGKTSLAQSIARALGRKLVRMSLGGVRDEAEIRGHRRTYIGSLPGRIIQGLRNAGTKNPVFVLDEIDKLGMDFRGDPSSALLEVLDPEQNHTFVDHYLEVPFDLSRVMFICTANMMDTVPLPLQDRMEVLRLPGYTREEKLAIAERYLLPRQLRENGLTADHLEITHDTLQKIIADYTREAGVRNLEREIGSVCRKVARRVAEGATEKVLVTPENVSEFLGPPKFFSEVADIKDRVGVANGLAWTPVGGEVLFIETAKMPGKGHLTLTGQLGDVMQESARTALSYLRAHAEEYGLPSDFFEKHDIHIHVPAGAIPKDGPSAGIAMTTALASLFSGRPARHDVAMTGEITLTGRVLPIGGVKEKVLAAKQADIHTVILPERNRKDLNDVPDVARKDMTFVFVKDIAEVLQVALHQSHDAHEAGDAPPEQRAPLAAQADGGGNQARKKRRMG
ncbi:MAG: endopeptidase La, partial [Abditibacteriales bacterium]|nr:endopeptidase La [Abditibacteriales bacterium]MDW8367086.1 endopeptidase La [Abditibacteriales bacterium]